MRIAIIINAKRLTPELSQSLEGGELTKRYNIDYDLFIAEPSEIKEKIQKLNVDQYQAILVGGGDGTVRTVVEELMNYDKPFIILPLGTFNVLAKSLNYPNDIDAIFSIIKNNKTKQIDVAEVNGKIIMNHAWIGFYSYIMHLREKHKTILGRSKLLKILFNTFFLFRPLPIYQLEVTANNEKQHFKTCLIYVGNNESYTNLLDFGDRKYFSTGFLSIIILNCKTHWDLLRCIFSILLNRFNDSKYVTQFNASELVIAGKNPQVDLVLDGDLFKLTSPLHFKNFQKKLTVIYP